MTDIVFTQPDSISLVDGERILFHRAPRAVRLIEKDGKMGLGFAPQAEEWSAWTTRFETKTAAMAVVPMLGCPKCAKVIYLPHTPMAANALGKLFGFKVHVICAIKQTGVVMSTVHCPHGCGFERKAGLIKLDEWSRVKRVYAAEIRRRGSLDVQTFYTHAVDQAEAQMQMALGPGEVLVAGPAPAIGWLGDEKTGEVDGR